MLKIDKNVYIQNNCSCCVTDTCKVYWGTRFFRYCERNTDASHKNPRSRNEVDDTVGLAHRWHIRNPVREYRCSSAGAIAYIDAFERSCASGCDLWSKRLCWEFVGGSASHAQTRREPHRCHLGVVLESERYLGCQ